MSIGKKILSAFVDIEEEQQHASSSAVNEKAAAVTRTDYIPPSQVSQQVSEKFKAYFNKLFADANMPGPDYYEFAKMIEAMSSIPDIRTRFNAVFAGLAVQGLDKNKLISTAKQYLDIIENDAKNFDSTLDATAKETVEGKKKEITDMQQRIQQLTNEIQDLTNKIQVASNTIKENEEKLQYNSAGYKNEYEVVKNKIMQDIENINQYIA